MRTEKRKKGRAQIKNERGGSDKDGKSETERTKTREEENNVTVRRV